MLQLCLLGIDFDIFRNVWPQLISLHDITMAFIIINSFLGYILSRYKIILDYFNIAIMIIFTLGISVPS